MSETEPAPLPQPANPAPNEGVPEPVRAAPEQPVAFETEHIAAGSGQVPESFQTEIVEKSER